MKLGTTKVWTLYHHWKIENGQARTKDTLLLSFLKKIRIIRSSEFDIYDYFINEDHLEWSNEEANEVINRIRNTSGLNLIEKQVLDVSGGNGIVASKIKETFSCKVVMTEVNQAAIDYARQLGIETYFWDINEQQPDFGRKFDAIFLRACLMFVEDIDAFLAVIRELLVKDGVLVIEHSVLPTLGVFLRVQKDPFSYKVLRNPETVIEACKRNSFALSSIECENDSSSYVYDFDSNIMTRWLWCFVEFFAVKKLLPLEHNIRRRNRYRSRIIFKKVDVAT